MQSQSDCIPQMRCCTVLGEVYFCAGNVGYPAVSIHMPHHRSSLPVIVFIRYVFAFTCLKWNYGGVLLANVSMTFCW